MNKTLMILAGCALAFFHCRAAERRLDLRPSPARSAGASTRLASASVSHEPGILRQTDLAPGATALPKLEVGDAIALELYDNVGRTIVLKSRLESSVGGEAFLASVEGYDGLRNAVVVQTAEGLQVDIQDFKQARVYTVVSSSAGTTVREIDPKAGKVAACDVLVPELKDPDVRTASASAAVQSSTVVDILVAYDQGAASWARRSGGGLDAFAQTSVAKMNAALANNGLDAHFRFRLVGTTEISVSAADVHQALYAIRDNTTGWEAIRAKRDEVGADIVTTLIDTGSAYGTTGVGWSLETKSIASFADSAYNVCAVRAVAQGHTMTHEVGHNMGAGHATAVNPGAISPGPQLYDYSAGYYFRANGRDYYTIMAYNYDGFGNSYDPAPLFSTPDVPWDGVPAGDAKHDNARTLANTYAEVTKWRAQKIALSYDVFFSPETETYFSDSLSVTLTSGKPGLEIRYTTDGSTPTLASTLYTVPFTLSQSTTVKAATVMDGVLGPVYEAHYFKNNLGTAINAPQLVWTTSSDYPWVTQTDCTFDGFAVKSSPDFVDNVNFGKTSWLKATVTGPTEMGFRYQKVMAAGAFRVYCDGAEVWADEEAEYGIDPYGAWKTAMIAIPAGRHEVKFAFEKGYGYYYGYNGVVVDTVCFDAWSHPPTLSPATTDSQATAKTFTGSMTVVLTPPAGRTGRIFYTLDGSDPTAEEAYEYEGPFAITKSAYVQAVFVEAGLEPSACVRGYYLERHPVKPGEWTTDVEGAKAAAKDGRLIAVLCANRGGCGWTQAFMPVAESPEFLTWASANGVYLITSDSSELVDTEAAYDYFWSLWGAGSVGYPSLAFAKPSAPDVCIASGTARNASGCAIGGVPYDDTVESLIRGFAKVMGIASVLSAPTVSPDKEQINSLPHTVTLGNPNGTGAIYYTLDGTAPTATHGTRYAGPVSISSKDAILTAVVIDSAGTIGVPIVRSFRFFTDFANAAFGTDGIVWTVDGSVGWQETSPEKGLRTGGRMGTENYVSTLAAKAPGCGRLRVTYRVCSWSNSNKATFSVDGVPKKTIGATWTDYVQETVELMTTGETTLSWSYAVDDPALDYSAGYLSGGKSAWCGVWVYDVEWVSYEPDETHYVVLFNANGGAGVMDALRLEPHRVHNLSPCAFSPPPNKTRFVGWACSNGRRYDDGMLVFDLAKPGETVTMTAIWESCIEF